MMRMLILEKSKRVESVRNHKSIKVTTVYLKRDEMRPIKGVIQSLSDFKPCRKHTSKLCHMDYGSTTVWFGMTMV